MERQKRSRPERSIYIPGQSRLSRGRSPNKNLSGSRVSSHCMTSSPCTSKGNDLVQISDETVNSLLSTDDKDSHIDGTESNKSISSQCNVDLVTHKKSCEAQPANSMWELANDLKGTTVCSDEKQSRNDRRQRQGKHPDIQRYVPKPKQLTQRDLPGSSVSSTVSAKSFDRRSSFELESASDRTKGAAVSSKSASASISQCSATQAPDVRKSSDHRDILDHASQFLQSDSTSAAENCNSQSVKSSAAASLSNTFGNLSLSASKTSEREGSGKCMPAKVKQKVSKLTECENSEPRQKMSECFYSASALRKAESDNRHKTSDSIRYEKLDWDFDGEFEYNIDGLSWGDLPPPSDHDWSDEADHDDRRVQADSSADTQKQKPQRPHGRRRRGARKKQIQNTKIPGKVGNDTAEGKLISSSRNSNTAVEAGGFECTKPETKVTAACQSVEDRESSIHSSDRLSKSHDVVDQCSEKVNTNRYSQMRHKKGIAEKPHLTIRTELEDSTGSEEQDNRNTLQNGGKQHTDANLRASKTEREGNTQRQRQDSGRVGGIIRLPVGTVTSASHVTTQSAASQVATTRGRHWRSGHRTAGRRALQNSDEPETLASSQQQGSAAYEQAQLHAAYPPHHYQRQSTSPQLYYTDYPPVSGASQIPAADGYIYSYPQLAYDGLGYVDDSYYH